MLKSQSPYEWYFIRAKEQMDQNINLLLVVFRDMLRLHTFRSTPIQCTYGDADEAEEALERITACTDLLRIYYGLYTNHRDQWEFTCPLHPMIRNSIENFLVEE